MARDLDAMRVWFPVLFSPRTFLLSKACDLGIHELRDVEAALGALHEPGLLEDAAQGASAFSQHQKISAGTAQDTGCRHPAPAREGERTRACSG